MKHPFEHWLEYFDSHDGRLHRRARGDNETDTNFLATIPTPPGSAILTVGLLREAVELMRRARQLEAENIDLRRSLGDLLLSADAMWEEKRLGHDWAEACEVARAVLRKKEV